MRIKKIIFWGCLVVGIVTLTCRLTPLQAANLTTMYFPSGILGEDTASLARYLTALQEPSLYELKSNPKTTAFRFLYLKNFEPPVAIRIEAQTNGGGVVCFKATDGSVGYKPGKLITEKRVKLDKTQIQACLNKFEEAGFWSLAPKDVNRDGWDGTLWVLEGVCNGKYHLVKRPSPERGSVRRLGLYFLKLSGEKISYFE